MAGHPQPRQRPAGAANEQAVAVGAKAHQHAPAAGERTAADALEDGGIGGHDEPSPCVALRLNGLHREGFSQCPIPPFRPSWPASSRALPRPCRRGGAPPSSTCCWGRPLPRVAMSPTLSWQAASRAAGARTTCSFQGTAFLLRIDPLERLNRRSRADPGIWIVAEALERFVERHGACAEVAERAPATAVRGVEQHDLIAVAGQA